jgi:glyoxylase-like metal-dependent hydrolase (beta-lactamase superfamily II)
VRVWLDDVGNGVTRIRMTSLGTRILGFEVSAFLVGDILVDTGFSYVRDPLFAALGGLKINLVCCTHHHEDHTGNCAAIAAAHGECPIYLRNAAAMWSEGVRLLAPYRKLWWGAVEPFEAHEFPDTVGSGDRRFDVVPAPGHSATQVALFEASTGDVFTGDLFISTGAAAILVWGNPWLEALSLRRVASLKPRRMLTGHGMIVDNPAPHLESKATRIEQAAERAVTLTGKGLQPREVVRKVFPKGGFKDRFFEWLTSREFSRLNFVLAAVRHAPGRLNVEAPER